MNLLLKPYKEVYVGLINDEKFVTYGQWDKPQCLNLPRQFEDNKRFAEVVWSRYGKKPGTARTRPSFKGWYLPQEMWNEPYTEEQIKGFRNFFTAVSKRCKELSGGLPVTVSPFFNPKLLGAEAFAETYGRFLKSGNETAGIDIVMLQDSVGAKKIPYDEIPAVVGGYNGAMRRKLDALGLKFWGNVESYVGEPRRPTEIDQLALQIETARTCGPQREDCHVRLLPLHEPLRLRPRERPHLRRRREATVLRILKEVCGRWVTAVRSQL